jgi:hypothetical protein
MKQYAKSSPPPEVTQSRMYSKLKSSRHIVEKTTCTFGHARKIFQSKGKRQKTGSPFFLPGAAPHQNREKESQ